MSEKAVSENKMGTAPIKSLVLSMSLPMMISMLVQSLYNVVDSVFVSRISADGAPMTAISLAFPIQSLMIALNAGMGVGMNAVLSRSLGEKDPAKASKAAMNGIFLAFVNAAIFLLIGLFLVRPFYRIQTEDETVIEYGVQYLSIICCLSIGVSLQMTMERILQSTGKTVYSMITQAMGAIINLILDPIMIFGLFGFPALGMRGAAIATIFGQLAASALALFFNLKVNKELTFSFKGLIPDIRLIGRIYVVGLPSIIMQSIGSVMVYGINKILYGFSQDAVTVFGVYFKVQSFIFMPIFGLNNGMIPIIAYNLGAGRGKRVKETIRFCLIIAECIMAVGVLIFQFCPGLLLNMFNASENMLIIGEPAFRIISVHFLMAGICIICSSSFQALGNGIYSMIISILRQLVVLLPAAYLLSLAGRLEIVWWAFPIAESAALLISVACMMRINKKVISKISG